MRDELFWRSLSVPYRWQITIDRELPQLHAAFRRQVETKEMARYGKGAQKNVEKVMHEYKEGTLRSGGSGKKVKNPRQAIAIGLSEARRSGAKVPPKRRE